MCENDENCVRGSYVEFSQANSYFLSFMWNLVKLSHIIMDE